MKTLDSARMPRLADKLRAKDEAPKEVVREKKVIKRKK